MQATTSSRRVRMMAAIIGGSAVMAACALTAAMHQEHTVGGPTASYFSKSPPHMTLGDTATTTPEPTVLPTATADPPVKAKRFGKS
jgi:hypothetical protein